MIEDAPRAVHLICDHSHRLLACSDTRARRFGRSIGEPRGRSLRRYATETLTCAELRWDRGWFDLAIRSRW